MAGYWEDAERTARHVRRAGFLKTGDLGFLARRPPLHLRPQSKEVIIVNGRNYYPQDMEWEASKVAGRPQGATSSLSARATRAGVERDRERVVLAFEVQDAERIGADRDPRDAGVRKRRARRHGAHARRRHRATSRRAAEDVERQAAASEDARTLRDAASSMGSDGRAAKCRSSTWRSRPRVSQLSYFKLAVLGGRKRKD